MSRSASAIVVLTLACMAGSAPAAAQQLPRARFGAGLGVTAPQADYKADSLGDGFNQGWQGMFFVEFREPKRPLGLRVDVVFGENPANDQFNGDVTLLVGQPTTVKLRMLAGNVDATYSFGRSAGRVGGYVLGGVGSVRATLSTTSGGLTVDQSENKFAWNAGGGVTYPVRLGVLFLEVRYCNVATAFGVSKLPFVAATAGLRFGRS